MSEVFGVILLLIVIHLLSNVVLLWQIVNPYCQNPDLSALKFIPSSVPRMHDEAAPKRTKLHATSNLTKQTIEVKVKYQWKCGVTLTAGTTIGSIGLLSDRYCNRVFTSLASDKCTEPVGAGKVLLREAFTGVGHGNSWCSLLLHAYEQVSEWMDAWWRPFGYESLIFTT